MPHPLRQFSLLARVPGCPDCCWPRARHTRRADPGPRRRSRRPRRARRAGDRHGRRPARDGGQPTRRGEFVLDAAPRGRIDIRVSMAGFRAASMTLDDSTPGRRRRHHHPRGQRRLRIGGGLGDSGRDAAHPGDVERHGDRPGRDSKPVSSHSVADALRTVRASPWHATGGPGAHHRGLPARRRVRLHAGADRRRARSTASAAASTSATVRRRTSTASRSCAGRRARCSGRTRSARSCR